MQSVIRPAPSQLFAQIGRFAGHVFCGTVGFVILALPAITLSLAAHYLAQTFVSEGVILVLLWLHYFLLGVDALMFVAYILVSIYAAVIELIRFVRDPW
jgi:hypothetical protein